MTAARLARVGAVLEGFALKYRRTWYSTLTGAFVGPVLFFVSLGMGLGGEIDDAGRLGGVSYADFVAPGLLAATAMQIAAAECTFPVMEGTRWTRTFHAILGTPVDVADFVAARLAWVAIRMTVSGAVFLGVVAAFGATRSGLAAVALPATVLTGLAFAAPIEAYAAASNREDTFVGIQRFGILPMFLFAGTFFPVDRLPRPLEVLAWLTPLWHGVELCRDMLTGAPRVADLGHAAVLVAFVVVGAVAARITYDRRMRT